MTFDKEHFQDIEGHRYLQVFPFGVITLRLSSNDHEEYKVARILDCGEKSLTVTCYDESKGIAWPPLAVPYETIVSVQFNPGKGVC